ncbi:HAD family hydrolase [Rhizobium sp. Root1220]|uniref:HAD family hydrolase n=1 Tax=Rhizobium sp. Root1220 TaxID=1736432 RepID=UPI0006F6DF68|nr:HAD family hydrolase [Rhizobium sp. Root1220]KQV82002.1 glycerol-3-phosphatase [Rhizobium sp. Root1220]
MTASHSVLGKSYDAFLFDMDGTLLNSIAVVERVWSGWALRHGLEPEVFLKTIHGIRAVDVIRQLALPGVDADREAKQLLDEEMEDVEGVIPIPGAVALLNSLPPEKWAIVTSAPIVLARRRMAAAGIPMPAVIVSGEEVAAGKPSPECYLLGASRLGVDPSKCLVFEDAVAGILAGEAAGADVAVITATHATPFETPHFSMPDYSSCRVSAIEGRIALTA